MANLLFGHVGSHIIAVVVSLVLHVGLIAFLTGNWETQEPRKMVAPSYINATLLQIEPKPKPKAKPKPQVDQAAKRRAEEKRKAEQRRKAEAERKRQEQKRAEERRKKERAEKERLAKQKREQEAARKAEQERLRQQEFASALADEEQLLQDATDAQVAASYSAYIRDRIVNRWNRPPSARRGMQVELMIQLLPNGQVVGVSVVKTSGNDAFDRSAERAVQTVERFDRLREVPSNIFERNFRRLRLVFSADDLRL